MQKSSQQIARSRRVTRWILLGFVAGFVVILFSGCMPGGQAPVRLSSDQFHAMGTDMAAIEKMTPAQLDAEDATLNKVVTEKGRDRSSSAVAEVSRAYLLKGYILEYRTTIGHKDPATRDYTTALTQYQNAASAATAYGDQARYRIGILAANNLLSTPKMKSSDLAKNTLGQLRGRFEVHIGPYQLSQGGDLWVRHPEIAGDGGPAVVMPSAPTAGTVIGSVMYPQEAAIAALSKLDVLYRTSGGWDEVKYNFMHRLVTTFTNLNPTYGAVLALIFLALVVKLITMPLTTASFRGMRDMQRVQPLIKELQEKYKDDKQKLAEEQMKLMKEHNVSVSGGCLPMIIQFPIFIIVWQAVNVYAANFTGAQFLWIHNLARPDPYLLILYAASMIVTQKLTATPSTDPQQKMMQQQMTYIMPLMFLVILKSIASAFLLYWFFLNVFSSIHQYYLMRKFKQEDDAAGAPATATGPSVPNVPGKTGKKGKRS